MHVSDLAVWESGIHPSTAPGLWEKALLESHIVSRFLEDGSKGSWQLFYSKPLPL